MQTFADLDDKIAFCFSSPTATPSRHNRQGTFSVLYLLRRELVETAGYDPNTDDEARVDADGIKHRLFVSLIAMFTAFDLLAKFQLGDQGGLGRRFTDFLVSPAGGGMQQADADLLYAVRNSVTHAFGVPDADSLAKLGLKGVELHQRVETREGLVVVQRKTWSKPPQTFAEVYIDGVFRALMASIENYRESLSVSVEARAQFESMFDKYGTIRMV